MRLIKLINIQRKETPIYYRKEYNAEAILEFLEKKLPKTNYQAVEAVFTEQQ